MTAHSSTPSPTTSCRPSSAPSSAPHTSSRSADPLRSLRRTRRGRRELLPRTRLPHDALIAREHRTSFPLGVVLTKDSRRIPGRAPRDRAHPIRAGSRTRIETGPQHGTTLPVNRRSRSRVHDPRRHPQRLPILRNRSRILQEIRALRRLTRVAITRTLRPISERTHIGPRSTGPRPPTLNIKLLRGVDHQLDHLIASLPRAHRIHRIRSFLRTRGHQTCHHHHHQCADSQACSTPTAKRLSHHRSPPSSTSYPR